jgi:hypothetical protein
MITIEAFPNLRLCDCGRRIQLRGLKLCNRCTNHTTRTPTWKEKMKVYLQKTGFDARMKQLGVSGEAEYRQLLQQQAAKKERLRLERKQAKSQLKQEKRLLKDKLKADYLQQQADAIKIDGEEWRDIPDYSKYQVSSMGRFRNKKFNRLMAMHCSKYTGGYANAQMYKDSKGNPHTLLAHRIVAQVFIPNPDNKSLVNHINHVRNDNRVCNLAWVTDSENSKASKNYYSTCSTISE